MKLELVSIKDSHGCPGCGQGDSLGLLITLTGDDYHRAEGSLREGKAGQSNQEEQEDSQGRSLSTRFGTADL